MVRRGLLSFGIFVFFRELGLSGGGIRLTVTQRPFLAGFGPPFLLWELSTASVERSLVHGELRRTLRSSSSLTSLQDKLGLSTTYPTFFLLNALAFMLVFFLARIAYGGYESILFFRVMWTRRHDIPLHLHRELDDPFTRQRLIWCSHLLHWQCLA